MTSRTVLLLVLVLSACARPAPARSAASEGDLDSIFKYIEESWSLLERSHRDLLAAAQDPKFPAPNGRWPVYVAQREDRALVEAQLRERMPPADYEKIEVLSLPASAGPGILYLPRPYVVPGGRFNEMYGWDSYFILLGLVRDQKVERARDMVDNFVYEIEHYGMILNANRSYYLTRSQPPFLTRMILAVFRATGDRAWLSTTVRAIDDTYAYWTREPHILPAAGLSRYHDLGSGPAPEVASEKDAQGRSHYERVRDFFRTHTIDDYDVTRFYDRASDTLTELFYVADRSMRESGYDPSNRFGPFNAKVLDFYPVCLNSLLFQHERDAAEIAALVGLREEAARWRARAAARAPLVRRFLWDAERALFLDYDHASGSRRDYPFGTTFFPLWAGLATPEHAAALVPRALQLLETPGGLRTSSNESGSQWDAPFGWAPLQLIAVEGLRRYGYTEEADRISTKFLSLVLKEFLEHGAIFEKYDVQRRESAVAAGLRFGYSSNEIGFGWTNAAFTRLFDALPPAKRAEVRWLHR